MDPKRAEDIARLVALASARDSSEWELFDAMRSRGIVGDELAAVGSLVPELGNMTAYVKAHNALRSFERDAMEPHMRFSMRHVDDVAKAARVGAESTKLTRKRAPR